MIIFSMYNAKPIKNTRPNRNPNFDGRPTPRAPFLQRATYARVENRISSVDFFFSKVKANNREQSPVNSIRPESGRIAVRGHRNRVKVSRQGTEAFYRRKSRPSVHVPIHRAHAPTSWPAVIII